MTSSRTIQVGEELAGRAMPRHGHLALRPAQARQLGPGQVPLSGEHGRAGKMRTLRPAGHAEALRVVVVDEQQVDLPELREPAGLRGIEVAQHDPEAVAFPPTDAQRLVPIAVVPQTQPPVGVFEKPPAGVVPRHSTQRHGDHLLGDAVLVVEPAVRDILVRSPSLSAIMRTASVVV
ncbi:MAG TPA: hypothetical protein VFM54_03655 [Micromonosporaceae bacterium]|nr:hypothetical protein [Micromonosporaceae bacterium]